MLPISIPSTALTLSSNKIEKNPVGRHPLPIPGQPRILNKPSIPTATKPWVPPDVVMLGKNPRRLMENAVAPMRDFFMYGPKFEVIEMGKVVLTRESKQSQIVKKLKEHKTSDEDISATTNILRTVPAYYNLLAGLNAQSLEISKSSKAFNIKKGDRMKDETKKSPNTVQFDNPNYKKSLNDPKDGEHLLQIIPIATDGNCFYSCISTALNLYNHHNPTSQYAFTTTDHANGTLHMISGTKFTQEVIRWAVVNEYKNTPGLLAIRILYSRLYIDGSQVDLESIMQEKETLKPLSDGNPLVTKHIHDFEIELNTLMAHDNVGYNGQIKDQIEIFKQTERYINADDPTKPALIESLIDTFYNENVGIQTLFLLKTPGRAPGNTDNIFTYPKSEEDAYGVLISPNHWSTDIDRIMVEKIFSIKPIVISTYEDTLSGVDTIGTNGTLHVRRSGVNIMDGSEITLRSGNMTPEEVDSINKIDKTVFLYFSGDSHYDLIVFGVGSRSDVEKNARKMANENVLGEENKGRQLVPTATRKRMGGGISRDRRQTRRHMRGEAAMTGGGGGYKDAIFTISPSNNIPPTQHSIDGNNILNGLRTAVINIIFDVDSRIPTYMLMFMYQQYNKNRGGDVETIVTDGVHIPLDEVESSQTTLENATANYYKYRLFYIEFLTIDTLINSMAIPDTQHMEDVDMDKMPEILNNFLIAYHRVFKRHQTSHILQTKPNYLPAVHHFLKDHRDPSQRGGAAPPGRDASRFAPTSEPVIATAPHMLNAMNPVTIAMDPSNVLSEHVMRIMNDDSSSLSFNVDVHLILAPGDNGIGIGDKVGYACESSKQDMSRSWSEITGKTYYPTARKE
jgi:hypothetical protein